MKTRTGRNWVSYIVIVLCLFGTGIIGEETLPRPLPLNGWSTPSPGWVSPVAPSSIAIDGAVEAAGQGSASSSHSSSITATGSSGTTANGWKAIEDPIVSYISVRDP